MPSAQPPIEVKIIDIKGNTPWLSTLEINGKLKPGTTFREYPPVAGNQFSLKAKTKMIRIPNMKYGMEVNVRLTGKIDCSQPGVFRHPISDPIVTPIRKERIAAVERRINVQ